MEQDWVSGRRSAVIPPVRCLRARRNDPQHVFRSQLPRGRAMKLHYHPETDSLYIELKGTPGVETREIVEGLVVDLDAKGSSGSILTAPPASSTYPRSRRLPFRRPAPRNDS